MIPKQLKDCRFCKILPKSKKPYEKDWVNNSYSYEEITPHFLNGNNYGILTGINQLGVLDDDTENKELIKLYEEHFPLTYQTREHKYIYFKGWDGKKIIFFDKQGKHCGELQGKGQQVVGAGSIHPSGEVYELKQDLPIIEIEFDLFKVVFKDYIIKKKKPTTENIQVANWDGDDIKDIPISNIISIGNLNDMGCDCYQGNHPKHGSVNGMNFRVDLKNNTWHCFRCSSGGGVSSLIAVMEGIISCSSAGSGCLSGDLGRKVIEVARQKYGLKTPITQQTLEPKGWARVLTISKIAEDKDFTKCPNCDKDFIFVDKLGWFKCNSCGIKGGLKSFLKLAIINTNKLKQEIQQ